jgi:predicted nucleic acid-binding protein
MGTALMPQSPIVAVDTNVLIDFADKDETVVDCFSTLKKKLPKALIIVVPTVIAELVHLSKSAEHETAGLSVIALKSLRSPWGFNPLNLIPVGHGIVEETARKIRAARLLPEEELHDSMIIVEAGLTKATILLTSDGHLSEIRHEELKKILDRDCDIDCPIIVTPWKIVHDHFNSVHR